MPNISSLTMPDGIVYAIKDSQARKDVEEIKKQMSGGSSEAASSVLDDLIECKSGIHLVSNAESVGDTAFACLKAKGINAGLGWYLESVNLPKARDIGQYAFASCTALTRVDLPNATNIGVSAFSGCTALTSINLPNATKIGGSAFANISPTAVINIGAAEGEISGAPWGAPDGVTINYTDKSITVGTHSR